MLRESPYGTFFEKNCYIFIKFGSEWLRRSPGEKKPSCLSSPYLLFDLRLYAFFSAFLQSFQREHMCELSLM